MSRRAAPEEICGVGEIASRYGVSRQRANGWAGRPDFPEPWRELERGRVWLWRDVQAWAEERFPSIAAAAR